MTQGGAVTGSTMQKRMLKAMMPSGMGERPARWQQQKSARTRLRLIEAAIDCLVEGGYAGLTTQAVAERTGVSRGAMHHHFPTRMELVAAVVEHVFYERMRLFLEDYLGEMARGAQGELVEVAAAAHWRSVQTREYAAYLEMAVAARSDAELNGFFEPVARRYDEVWTAEMIESFPQWRDQWETMKLASDFVTVAHMGLLLQRPVMGEARIAAIHALIARVLGGLYDT
ncbi:TetR/AcrR family transcriptional regulator [Novosphingobium cyanobacteriorum]|uniref:TetR/AcrR family transcriptional regulator n=1 Tax=Novosphingobium cyanobacteriorum TaxID=3024215 RepID=A0ABT6CNA6_9SPHN|nr:TetR/AcrR family transcriptional regulator [Novosphingobium cyanobacteriorum]MDF8335337.1 TetR/AcrR family transcriptional regulator [Novosphingobium cyanobacteriorum]